MHCTIQSYYAHLKLVDTLLLNLNYNKNIIIDMAEIN